MSAPSNRVASIATAILLAFGAAPAAVAQVPLAPPGAQKLDKEIGPSTADGESTILAKDRPSDTLGTAPNAVITGRWGPPIQLPSVTQGTQFAFQTVPKKGKVLAHPRPGQDITLSATRSSDADAKIGDPLSYQWSVQVNDVNLDGSQSSEPITSTEAVVPVHTRFLTRSIVATLTVTDKTGLKSTAQYKLKVVPNLPPRVTLDHFRKQVRVRHPAFTDGLKFSAQGDLEIHDALPTKAQTALREILEVARVSKPKTVFANAGDPDGTVVGYDYKIEGGPADAAPSALTKNELVFIPRDPSPNPAPLTITVTVTDDEGASATTQLTVRVLTVCEPHPVKFQKIKVAAITGCLLPVKAEGPTREYRATKGTIDVNGLTIYGDGFTITESKGAAAIKTASGQSALVEVLATSGARTYLHSGPLRLGITPQGDVTGLNLASVDAQISGLEIASLKSARTKGAAVELEVVPVVPPVYNTSTAPQAMTVTSVPAVQAASLASVRARASAAAQTFSVPQMDIAGMTIKKAKVTFQGTDTWNIEGDFAFADPLTIPGIKASASIVNGGFGHLSAVTTFPGTGIAVGSEVYLKGVNITLTLATPVESPCVPHIGVKDHSQKDARDNGFGAYLKAKGFAHDVIYKLMPDYRSDHGVPNFSFCGGIAFRVGAAPVILGEYIAEGSIYLGIVDYPDRPGVLRIVAGEKFTEGQELKIIGADGDLMLEVFEDGYVNAEAGLTFLVPDILRVIAGFSFEARFPKFNAQAYAEVCIYLFDIGCAGMQALLGSRGAALCLAVYIFGGKWTPGATAEWKPLDVTPYLDGCDVDSVKAAIKEGGNVKYKFLEEGVLGKAAQAEPAFPPGEVIDLPIKAGIPGVIVAVESVGGLPKFTLQRGRARITVDDQPSPNKLFPVSNGQPIVVKSLGRRPVTQVILPLGANAPASTIRVMIEGERPARVRVIEGAPKPRVARARLARSGAARELSLEVSDPRRGMTVDIVEAGGTGGQSLGRYRLTPGRTVLKPIRFVPANAVKEERTIRLVFERNGIPAHVVDLPQYTAPTPPAPRPPARVDVRRGARGIAATWPAAEGAREYLVEVRVGDGRLIKLRTRARRAQVRMPLARFDDVRVGVRSVGAHERQSPFRVTRSRATSKRKVPRLTPAQRKAVGL